jgi:1-deoxy-D-xylulose-5-phosphate reductoisomerase
MRVPIRTALYYPARPHSNSMVPFDLARIGELHFGPVDYRRYPALALALKAGRRGQTYPAALAAADEVAVDHFLAGHMAFGDIPRLLDDVLNAHDPLSDNEIDDVLAADTWARAQADDWVRARV